MIDKLNRQRVSIYQSYIGGLPPASALSFSHVDVGDAFQIINHLMAERRRNTTGRSGRALAFKPTGRGFETNSGGTRTPSVNHQGERKAFQAYCISPYIKLIRVD